MAAPSTHKKTVSNGQVAQASAPPTVRAPKSTLGRPLAFFALFIPFCASLVWFICWLHYTLPEPVNDLRDAVTGLPHFSEAKALEYVKHYSEAIGYRILGTPEMDQTLEYTLQILDGLKQDLAHNAHVQLEVDHQKGDGSHLFDFMHKKVWKKYYGISNIVVRLSNGTDASKEDAILVNAHLDSTLPSPGAADDGAGVAVMLETIRVLAQSPNLKLDNAIVFLFNGAEESLQDASHLFITQHPWRSTIRAAINLEACGSKGAEMLFQATSTEMIHAFAKSPRPLGSIMATEVFETGLIMSDTDFRQFEQYGGLTGLDLALVRDSYKYHTRLDTVEYLEPGALQHFGENVIAMLTYLAAEPKANLRSIKKAKETLYFTLLGGKAIVVLNDSSALIIYVVLFLAAAALAFSRARLDRVTGYIVTFLSFPASLVSAIVAANSVAALMSLVLDKPMSYFSREWYCLPLYGLPALTGVLACQYVTASIIEYGAFFKKGEGLMQHALLTSGMLFHTGSALLGHSSGILSSYLFAISGLPMFFALAINDLVLASGSGAAGRRSISTLTYLIAQSLPMLLGTEALTGLLDVFIPLTGRMGSDAPADFLVATAVSASVFLAVPAIPALCHRWGSAFLRRMLVLFTLATTLVIAVFSARSWQQFDYEHPQRVLCLYMENMTSNDLTLHMSGIDAAKTRFSDIIGSTSEQLQLSAEPVQVKMSDDIPDWDIIYPVSQFLHPYRIPLPALASDYVSPFKQSFTVTLLESRLNAVQETRHLRIRINHPGIIWTVCAFSADVISWDLPEAPERGIQRHHIKEASAYNVSSYTLSMTLQLGKEEFQAALRQSQREKGQRPREAVEEEQDRSLAGLKIDFSGLDVNRMWHAQGNGDRAGMEFVQRLDSVLPKWTDPSEYLLA